MALIDITPIMTSNNTPAPYAVSASSEHATGPHFGYYAVDSIPSTAWIATTIKEWLKINFGSKTQIDAYSIQSVATNSNRAPKSFVLYGSDDDLSYEAIDSRNSEILWQPNETRLYKLNNSVSYIYYKLVISENDGGSYTSIKELKFFQEDTIEEKVNYKNLPYFNYMLPKATTHKLKNIVNDDREGLLIMANDPDNYGTLHVINKYGNTEIIKTDMSNHDVLWEGNANSANTIITLSNPVTDYKYLLIIQGGGSIGYTTVLIETNTIRSFVSTITSDINAYTTIIANILPNSSNEIKITSVFSKYWSAGLSKIIGIK